MGFAFALAVVFTTGFGLAALVAAAGWTATTWALGDATRAAAGGVEAGLADAGGTAAWVAVVGPARDVIAGCTIDTGAVLTGCTIDTGAALTGRKAGRAVWLGAVIEAEGAAAVLPDAWLIPMATTAQAATAIDAAQDDSTRPTFM